MFATNHHFDIEGEYAWLLKKELISKNILHAALNESRKFSVSIEHILVDRYKLDIAEIGHSLSLFHEMPYLAFNKDLIKPTELVKKIKRDQLLRSGWLPIEDLGGKISVVTIDPTISRQSSNDRINPNALFGKPVIWNVTTRTEFILFLDLMFGSVSINNDLSQSQSQNEMSINEIVANLSDDDSDIESVDDTVDGEQDNELIKLVNRIVIEAYQRKASDIHIEPVLRNPLTNSVLNVRFRIDGELKRYAEIPFRLRTAVLSRLKIISGLDIAEKRRPQDGKFKVHMANGDSFEMRIATIPTQQGMENAVIRILASGAKPMPINRAGFSIRNERMIRSAIEKPYGLFFVCGPTGSGKTTTLHSILSHINTENTKIWTVEDPVEIAQEGLCQVQINRKAGIDFATAMRSFLRADPDVIMVGEMRDKETVSIGVEASLTGHLVLSTLHTNSAPESIIRLLDMGVDPFNFADALLGILAQRLVKTLCPDCKEIYTPLPSEVNMLIHTYCEDLQIRPEFQDDYAFAIQSNLQEFIEKFGTNGELFFARPSATGCDKCGGTGYKGRIGLHEFLLANDDVKTAIQQHKRPAEIAKVAFLTADFRTLEQDGIEKVFQGIVDMKEVRKVCIK